MQETGVRNGAHGADKFGFKNLAGMHWNLPDTLLVEHAIRNGEGALVKAAPFAPRPACIPAAARRTSIPSSTR